MYKLLLVDDEQIIREGLARMIDWEGLGLTLTASCSNALAALDSMTDDMPDILLADVRMPGMDGLELVERAMALHPQLQAIILSGYDTFQYAQQAIKTGGDGIPAQALFPGGAYLRPGARLPGGGPAAAACAAPVRGAPGAH